MFPSFSLSIFSKILLVPSAFTKVTGEAHWEILLRARAIETQCYVCDICVLYYFNNFDILPNINEKKEDYIS